MLKQHAGDELVGLVGRHGGVKAERAGRERFPPALQRRMVGLGLRDLLGHLLLREAFVLELHFHIIQLGQGGEDQQHQPRDDDHAAQQDVEQGFFAPGKLVAHDASPPFRKQLALK